MIQDYHLMTFGPEYHRHEVLRLHCEVYAKLNKEFEVARPDCRTYQYMAMLCVHCYDKFGSQTDYELDRITGGEW